jgi:NAD(P)-dependent dehydrogenase (short-subunit alcohol dehydrogenase family)
MSIRWTAGKMPNLQGKVAVVTGANSGVGYESALALAGKGAQVVLAVRSEEKGQKALKTIKGVFPNSNAEVMMLDLASLESIRSFADQFKAKYERLDILLNNAGMMAIPFRKTMDGFEMQFGIDHLGHFALTGSLMPVLLQTPKARVVTVSSINHNMGWIDFDNLDGAHGYGKWKAYNQSKLANLLFAYELQRKLENAKADAISIGTHPGYSATNLQLVGPRMSGSRLMEVMFILANALFAQSAAMGALPLLYASVAPQVKGGDYIGPDGLNGVWGYPIVTRSNGRSHDLDSAKKLWEISEEMTGISYQFR